MAELFSTIRDEEYRKTAIYLRGLICCGYDDRNIASMIEPYWENVKIIKSEEPYYITKVARERNKTLESELNVKLRQLINSYLVNIENKDVLFVDGKMSFEDFSALRYIKENGEYYFTKDIETVSYMQKHSVVDDIVLDALKEYFIDIEEKFKTKSIVGKLVHKLTGKELTDYKIENGELVHEIREQVPDYEAMRIRKMCNGGVDDYDDVVYETIITKIRI